MIKRNIRLKEGRPNLEDHVTPSEAYLQKTDGTLKQRDFLRRITSEGFLNTGVKPEPTQPNMFFLGGSFVESMFHDEDKRFVAQLARRLPVNALNGGYSGMTSMQMATMLIAKIGGLASPGDFVIAAVPMSDLPQLRTTGSYWTKVKSHALIDPPNGSTIEPSFSHTRAAWAAMNGFCTQIGISFVMMTGPRRLSDFNRDQWARNAYRRRRASWEEDAKIAQKLNQNARDFASQEKIPLIDLDRQFSDKHDKFYDHVHLNDAGQDAVAQYLENELMRIIQL